MIVAITVVYNEKTIIDPLSRRVARSVLFGVRFI